MALKRFHTKKKLTLLLTNIVAVAYPDTTHNILKKVTKKYVPAKDVIEPRIKLYLILVYVLIQLLSAQNLGNSNKLKSTSYSLYSRCYKQINHV